MAKTPRQQGKALFFHVYFTGSFVKETGKNRSGMNRVKGERHSGDIKATGGML
ncbi:MAG: hypothetical protein P0Y53_09235 [Candidatus Pseudobacter hemicellulosilyticus]|uniref:Uncharacterized protein n=1 Tax=Candidatus Pseudobacter hemicellulosilyticus TaxID=3121375 RepID=A0AAJ6BJ92_9BACT|nr:MAG: hypothetical protein P0Y53_09235 [Pseudobacter sp.]